MIWHPQKCGCFCLSIFHKVHFLKCSTLSLVQSACHSQLWPTWATLKASIWHMTEGSLKGNTALYMLGLAQLWVTSVHLCCLKHFIRTQHLFLCIHHTLFTKQKHCGYGIVLLPKCSMTSLYKGDFRRDFLRIPRSFTAKRILGGIFFFFMLEVM